MNIAAAPAHRGNFSARPLGTKPRAVVYHETGGTAASAIAWFQDPTSRVSAHYIVGVGGTIYNCVPETMKAWHAGESVLWNEPDVNSYSLGVELEHAGEGIYPAAQIEALLMLAADISERYRIPLHAHVGHLHVCLPKGRKVDPQDFDWYSFLNALGHRLLTFKAVA